MDCIIALYFANTRKALNLGLAAMDSGTGLIDSHLDFSVNSLEISLSQEETDDPANLLNNWGGLTHSQQPSAIIITAQLFL